MSIETDVITYLNTKSAITAQTTHSNLKGISQTHIFGGTAPEDADYPLVIVKRISGGYGHTLDGGAGFAAPVLQIDVMATRYTTSKVITEAIRNAMQGYRGTMGSSTVGSVVLQNEVDVPGPNVDASGHDIQHTALDYFIHHQVSVPTST